MNAINPYRIADLFFQIHWRSDGVRHTDAYAASAVNFWRDILPHRLRSGLAGKLPGDRLILEFSPDELFSGGQSDGPDTLSRSQFDPARIGSDGLPLLAGRFYPRGVLRDVAGVFSANREPFRCVEISNGYFKAAMGHPLSSRPVLLDITVGAVNAKSDERGGSLVDWMETICRGACMPTPRTRCSMPDRAWSSTWMTRPWIWFASSTGALSKTACAFWT